GVWLDSHTETECTITTACRNEREIQSAIELAKRNRNVIGIVVGNETQYRAELKIDDLLDYIKRVKRSVSVPVTTGEIWNIWRDNPCRKDADGKDIQGACLTNKADFIAAPVLPYWENATADQAV